MGHGGMLVPHSGRGLDQAQPAGSWVGKGPLAGFRYQDGRAGRRGWTLVLPSLEFVSVADG